VFAVARTFHRTVLIRQPFIFMAAFAAGGAQGVLSVAFVAVLVVLVFAIDAFKRYRVQRELQRATRDDER
jgi:hypothetical protein